MKLLNNTQLKNEIWEKHHKEIFATLPEEFKTAYQFIFQLNDYKSFLHLQNEAVQNHIDMIQATFVENIIKVSLEEIFENENYKTELPDNQTIYIHSRFQMGTIHKITETEQPGFILQRITQSNPAKILDQKHCNEIDDLINTIAGLEDSFRVRKIKN